MAGPAHAAAPRFDGENQLASDTGHVLLAWQADEPVTLTISEAADPAMVRPVYRGSEHSYFLSGLRDGEYTLTLEADSGAVSDPVVLTVEHQSLQQAMWLTAIGLVIALAIMVTVLRGARDDD